MRCTCGANIQVCVSRTHNYIQKRGILILTNMNKGYTPTVASIGYMGLGKHGAVDLPYRRWRGIVSRCYDPRYAEQFPSHYGICTVSEDWHNYQNFAEWFYLNMPENFSTDHKLDKDLLVKGNKVYSSTTCCFLPNRLNIAIYDKMKKNRDGLPAGVTRTDGNSSIYRVRCSDVNGKCVHLGTFRDIELAFAVYSEFKKNTLNLLADKYLQEKMITPLTHRAIINYDLQIMNNTGILK